MQFVFFRVLIKRIQAIRFLMKDKAVPKRKKALIILGIVYLFLPVDLIPPILFPIAWMDDMVIWLFILWHLKDELDSYWLGPKESKPSEVYKGKKIIEDVAFEVKVDDDKKKE
ncbi:MAG: DUF1232 domain-containing protein [Anaerovorax sp.]